MLFVSYLTTFRIQDCYQSVKTKQNKKTQTPNPHHPKNHLDVLILFCSLSATCIYKSRQFQTLCGSINAIISLWPTMKNLFCLHHLLFLATWLPCSVVYVKEERQTRLQMGQVWTVIIKKNAVTFLIWLKQTVRKVLCSWL